MKLTLDLHSGYQLVINGITNVCSGVGGLKSRENKLPHNIISVDFNTAVWFQYLSVA